MNHRTVNHSATGRQTAANAGFSKPGTEAKSSANRAFVEDFNMEHSRSNVSVKLMAFSAPAEAMESGASRNSYGPSKTLPSCVYLG